MHCDMEQLVLEAMGKVVLLVCLVALAIVAEGREWRFDSVKRIKRGYNGFGNNDSGYGQSDEQNASVSKEGCSGESRGSNSGSRELAYNRDGRYDNNRRGNRSFTKSSASASASASAFNLNQKPNL